MFYIIETKYVGPNQMSACYIDSHIFAVSTTPAVTNSSREIRTDGWCGTTNDWATYAHGEFLEQEAAEGWIKDSLADTGYREDDLEDVSQSFIEDQNIVARFRAGRHEPMSPESTSEWAYPALDEVTADTSDSDLDSMIENCIEDGHIHEGVELDADTLRKAFLERRQEERDKLDEDL